MTFEWVKWAKEYEASAPLSVDARTRRRNGVPTVFEDEYPVKVINDWTAYLSTQSESRETWKTYVYEIVRFAEFLRENFGLDVADETLYEIGDDAMRAYYLKCLDPDNRDSGVGDSRSTLGKRRAALMSFYRYTSRPHGGALTRGFPFRLVTVQSKKGPIETLAGLRGGRRTIPARNPVPGTQIDRFLDVGLMGFTPDGEPDPSFRRVGSASRAGAGFGLAAGAGLRHAEILLFTVFELPPPEPDGLTPLQVGDLTTKGNKGRKVIAFSRWLQPAHAYVVSERRVISRNAKWRPRGRVREIDVTETNRHRVRFVIPGRKPVTVNWTQLDPEDRLEMVIPGNGSPLLLLDHRTRDGRPITGRDALGDSMKQARKRCRTFWPTEDWAFDVHSGRHTYGTELIRFIRTGTERGQAFYAEHGRYPLWYPMVTRSDIALLTADSMGHASFDTTMDYLQNELWNALLAVNADPALNPALTGVLT